MSAPWHDVEVVWPDGSKSEDGIRGWDRDHALENAEWNWISGNPYGRAERIEYVGPSPDPTLNACGSRDAAPQDSDDETQEQGQP